MFFVQEYEYILNPIFRKKGMWCLHWNRNDVTSITLQSQAASEIVTTTLAGDSRWQNFQCSLQMQRSVWQWGPSQYKDVVLPV